MKFYLLVKSGCDFPDLEDEITAKNRKSAVKILSIKHRLPEYVIEDNLKEEI